MPTVKFCVGTPRSIVTDQRTITYDFGNGPVICWTNIFNCIGPANNSISKSTPASKSAYGISLYVSDDPQGSNVCNTMVRRVPWPGGATGKSFKQQALDSWDRIV